MRKFRATILLFAICLSGCATTISDVSTKDYFRDSIGKSLPLLREQILCAVPDDINYRAVRPITLISTNAGCPLKKITLLPVGTIVYIESVKKQDMPISGDSWHALGNVTVDNKTYEFEYWYGYTSINRAPWESASVPLNRPIPK